MSDKKEVFSHGTEFYANLGQSTMRIVEEVLKLDKNRVIDRIWKRDHTVWSDKSDEISNRLGWLSCTEIKSDALDEIDKFVKEVRAAGFTDAILLGMGGSSLTADVLQHTFGTAPGHLRLHILDSTDPAAVLSIKESLDLRKTIFIVATKSGGTIETISFMKYFYHLVKKNLGAANTGSHFCAITDPGSGLEKMARNLNFRAIFLNDPNIGGRYSALSHFGLVPAAMLGISTKKLIERGMNAVVKFRASPLPEAGANSAAWLGAILGGFEKRGKNKLTLVTSPEITYLGAWIEQLIAESTGKNGRGILPVDQEVPEEPDKYLEDRVFIYLKLQGKSDHLDDWMNKIEAAGLPVVRVQLNDLFDLGSEFFRWEFATAVGGAVMHINPFNQPNVESAKVRAKQMMESYIQKGTLPDLSVNIETDDFKIVATNGASSVPELIGTFFSPLENLTDVEGELPYISLQAYINPSDRNAKQLDALRHTLRERFRCAVTAGYGPRFLHSTGQLHKGDGGKGLFIQILAEEGPDCRIPEDVLSEESKISFRILKRAQALGDRQALIDAGRNVIMFDLNGTAASGMKIIQETIGNL